MVRFGARRVPAEPPDSGGFERPTVEQAVRRTSRRRPLIAAAIIALLAAMAALWRQSSPATPAVTHPEVKAARVRTGTIQRTLRLTGVTVAETSALVLAPSLPGGRGRGGSSDFSMTLETVKPPGSRVRAGEEVAAFDAQYMITRLDDYRTAVAQEEANLRKLFANLDVRRHAYQQRTRAANGRAEKSALDLKTSPVRSYIQAERFRLNLEEAEAQHRQLVEESRYVEISERAQIRRYELELKESHLELKRAESNLAKLTVRAPIDGIVVMEQVNRGGEMAEIRAGDQMRRGQSLMQIMDPSRMLVNAEVSQVDCERLRLGARAVVRPDAVPGLELPARLYSVGAIARASRYRGSFVTNVPVRLRVEATDPRLIPNYSVSVDVILEEAENALILPLDAVLTDASDTSKGQVWVRKPNGWEQRSVQLGLSSNVEVAILAGLNVGEEVAAGKEALRGFLSSSN